MRVLWISYLLIGCMTCFPVGKEPGADLRFMRWPLSSGVWFSGTGVSSDPSGGSSSSPLPSLPNPSFNQAAGLHAPRDGFSRPGPGSLNNMAVGDAFGSDGDGHYNSPEVPAYEVAHAGHRAPDGGLDRAHRRWRPEPADGYDAAEKVPESVFSDVSALDPIYTLSSRSSYQRGRRVFAQTRYAPGRSVRPPRMPRPGAVGTTAEQSGATKGGF